MHIPFKTVGVLGAGQMGAGIAQVVSSVAQVLVFDPKAGQVEKALGNIGQSLQKFVQKGQLESHQAEAQLKALRPVARWEELKDCDLVIEAVAEQETLKAELFCALDQILPPHAILVSNTSSIPLTRLASQTKRPEQVMGMHFMNPVPLMKLVELIPSHKTSEHTLAQVKNFALALKKEVVISRDYPGFIINRILMPMINEAFFALMEGVASPKDIDLGMKLGTNQPMGPLELADFIGLDTCLAILEVMHKGLGDSKYRPCPLLRIYVEAGEYGRKTKKGVYSY